MSSDWPLARLGNYCQKIGSGATPRGGSSVYLDEGPVSLIRSQNIYNEGFKLGGLTYIDEDAADKLKNVIVEADDVLLNITGDSVARVCLVPEQYLPARVNQHVAIIRPNPKEFDSRFIRYYLITPTMQSYLLALAGSGATRNALTKGMIEGLEIPKPDINVQREIADVLSSLDDKIQLNHRINQTFEQIAQAIFKFWFVDFEPVKAKIAAKKRWMAINEKIECCSPTCYAGQFEDNKQTEVGLDETMTRAAMRAISGKADEELDQLSKEQLQQLTTTAALFPDELEGSELGEIPKGWSVKLLGDICSRIVMGPFGSNIKKDNFIDSGVPVIRGGNLTHGLIEEGYVFLSEEKADQLRNSNAFPEDIVITHRGTLGQIAIIPSNCDYKRYVVSQSQMALTVDKTKASPRFVHEFLVSGKGRHLVLANRSQVGVPAIARPTSSMKSISLVVPTIDLLKSFDFYTQWMYYLAVENNKTTSVLSDVRDALLPKLLSGEITPTDTQSSKEAVA